MMTLQDQGEPAGPGMTVWLRGALAVHNRSENPLTLQINVNGSWDYLDLQPDEQRTYQKYRSKITIADEIIELGKYYHVSVDSVAVIQHPVGFMEPFIATLYLRPLSKSRQHLYIANMTGHPMIIAFSINNGKTLEVIARPKGITRERVGNLPLWIGSVTMLPSKLYVLQAGTLTTYEEYHDPILRQWHSVLTSCFGGTQESAILDEGNDPA